MTTNRTITLFLDAYEAAFVATAIRQRIDRLETLSLECRQRHDASGAIHYTLVIKRAKRVLEALNAGDVKATVRGDGGSAFND